MDAEKARVHKDHAAALLLQGQVAAALHELRQAVAADPRDLPARRKLADVLAREGRVEDAVGHYQHLAGRYATSGQLLEAIAIGKVILRLDPSHTRTQQALAQFAEQRTREEEWNAEIPESMAGLIEDNRLRGGASGEVSVSMKGGQQKGLPREVPREVIVELLGRLELRTFAPGESIVVEGAKGASLFIIVSGAAKVARAERTLAKLSEGAFFGEIAVIADVPRLASVIADGDCVVLEVPRPLLGELCARHPGLDAMLQRHCKERLLANLLDSSEFFRALAQDARERLIDSFRVRSAGRGDTLLRQGDEGPGLFALLRGRVVCFDEPSGSEYPELGEGAVFGEISLLEGCHATATVRAESPVVLLFLDKEAVKIELIESPAAAAKLRELAQERLDRSSAVQTEEILPSLI